MSSCHFVQVNKQMLWCVICMDVRFLSDCSAFPFPSRQLQCHGIVTCINCQNQPFKYNVYNTILCCRIRNANHICYPKRRLDLDNQSFMPVDTHNFLSSDSIRNDNISRAYEEHMFSSLAVGRYAILFRPREHNHVY